MSEAIGRVVAALRAAGSDPKPNGVGWKARCPAHDDRNPSLSVTPGRDGRALVRCFAGCETKKIAEAIGLTLPDLFDARSGGDRAVSPAQASASFPTANAAAKAIETRAGRRASHRWIYRDERGDPLGLVLRLDGPDGKEIRPVSKLPDGRWCVRAMPEPRPLYRLPELLAAAPEAVAFVVEGEKCADAAAACGLLATTSPGGALAAAKADWSPLAGRRVVVLPDRDDAGEAFAETVTRLARDAGARSVRIVRLWSAWPDMPAGGDIADLLERFGGDADATREAVERLAAEAEAATTPSDPLLASGASTKPPRTSSDRTVSVSATAYVPFPVAELPDPFAEFVAPAARAIGCDSALVALPLLAAGAAAVGNARSVELKRGWREPCALWSCVVADSGSSKTPAAAAALAPLRMAQRDAAKEHAEAQAEHSAELLRHEAALARWRKDAATRSDPGDPPTAPAPPAARRLIVGDTTVEALAPILLANPRGVLVARDELAGWLGSFDAYRGGRGGDAAAWLSLHNGEPITVDRKAGGSLHVPSGLVSICGGVQPGAFARAIGDEHRENGLLARLLLAMPPRRVKAWTERVVDPMTGFALARAFDRLLALKGEPDANGDDRPVALTLDCDAKRLWIDFFNANAETTAALAGAEAACFSKLEAACARLALLFRLVEEPDATTIDAAAMRRAIALARWFGREALRVYDDLAGGSEAREARSLADWIERSGNDLTAAEVSRGLRRFRGDAEAAEHALIDLERRGFGRWIVQPSGERGGRPTRRFRVEAGDGCAEPPANADNGAGLVDATLEEA